MFQTFSIVGVYLTSSNDQTINPDMNTTLTVKCTHTHTRARAEFPEEKRRWTCVREQECRCFYHQFIVLFMEREVKV